MDLNIGGDASGDLNVAGQISADVQGAVSAVGSAEGDISAATSVEGALSADAQAAVSAGGSVVGAVSADVQAAASASVQADAGVSGTIEGAAGVEESAFGSLTGAATSVVGGAASVVGSGLGAVVDVASQVSMFSGLLGGLAKEPDAYGGLIKAEFWDEDKDELVLTCMYNPEEFKVEKTLGASSSQSLPSYNVPPTYFTGGKPQKLTIQKLWFDTYVQKQLETGVGSHLPGLSKKDVRTYTNKLFDLMKIDDEKPGYLPGSPAGNVKAPISAGSTGAGHKRGRPHKVTFRWGSQRWGPGVIISVSIDFVLFDTDGTPMRARASVTMQQVEEASQLPGQNPTSGGEDLRASHLVVPGETLDLIAYQEYGDSSLWRILAGANNLEDPLAIRPGQRLRVPAR